LLKSLAVLCGFKTTLIRISLLIGIALTLLPGGHAWGASIKTRSGQPAPRLQASTPEPTSIAQQKAALLLQQMTPEERVGQLFLVTFSGPSADIDSQIYDLVTNYYVAGVVLLASNDNFTGGDQILNNTIALTNQLQNARLITSKEERINPDTNESFSPPFIPLFIGINQEGDGSPYDQILSALTPLPNEMAIGATWNPELAKSAGSVMGEELAALGFNLLLGPSLDVLEAPHSETASDMGSRTFGGDPYWVSNHGKAFVEGIHTGSDGRIAVIAKHFPGYGGSDRLPEEEVATVRKSLDQLIGFELTPFFEVTGNAPSPAATADGLLTAHIRYQGFQGNIRATTRPISFDPQALSLLLKLPPIDAWRNNGGIMVSDNLGSQAIRGFYDLTSQTFDMVRRVALNAFLAGNDLLYVADFSSGDEDSFSSAKRTLGFFAQKYREDQAFAQRVDESVLRILTLKYKLYGDFSLVKVLTSTNPNTPFGMATQVPFDVARQAATLLSPTQAELDDTMPDPPDQSDRIVFITDVRTAQQCSTCTPDPLIGEKTLEETVLRLYGPQAGGRVSANNLLSYSMQELQEMLDGKPGETAIERSLSRANWVVFSMLDAKARFPSYQTLSRFLTERTDLFQKTRLVVFAFNAPYYLDATNISKLTAYYGLYSKISQSIDISAYLLFQEQRAQGASPVSVPGIGYDLNEIMFPNPQQIISIEIEQPNEETLEATPVITPEPTPIPTFRVGDVIPLRTSVILDHNGHPVPDGTPVEFLFNTIGENNQIRQVESTANGIARTSYSVTSSGTLEIQAISEPAQPGLLQLDIPPTAGGTEPPTSEPILTQTVQPSPSQTSTPIPDAASLPTLPKSPQFGDWIMAVILAMGIAFAAYKLISLTGQPRWGMRAGFLALIGGLFAYSYLVLQLPGSNTVLHRSISQGVFLATLVGIGIGLLLVWIWHALASRPKRKH
jgi:beta-N-acetylhexosaminidase